MRYGPTCCSPVCNKYLHNSFRVSGIVRLNKIILICLNIQVYIVFMYLEWFMRNMQITIL